MGMGLCMNGCINLLRVYLLEADGDSRRVLFHEARYRIPESVKVFVFLH